MKVVCLGDSVTRGVSYVQGRLRILKNNYPAALQTLLHYPVEVEVLNKGVFNDNSDGVLGRLAKDVFHVAPDVVLVEIGGNDCNFRWNEVATNPDSEHEAIVPIERYIENLTTLVKTCRRQGVVPVLLTILPLDPVRYYQSISTKYGAGIAHWISVCGGIEHWHGMYNRALRQLIQSLRVPSIDVRTGFKESGDLQELLSDDGIHPSESGYEVLSRLVAKGLPRLLLQIHETPTS